MNMIHPHLFKNPIGEPPLFEHRPVNVEPETIVPMGTPLLGSRYPHAGKFGKGGGVPGTHTHTAPSASIFFIGLFFTNRYKLRFSSGSTSFSPATVPVSVGSATCICQGMLPTSYRG